MRARLMGAMAVAQLLTGVLAGCAPGPSAGPHFAMDEGHGNAGPATTPPPSGPPSIDRPKVDLSWQDCTREVLGSANITTSPTFTLECAEYKAPLDPINGAPGSVTLGAVRAKTSQTPADAGPLVFTTGSDLPSSVQLATWLNGPGAQVLKQRPVVAVDRRGIGRSDAITCRDTWDLRDMRDLAQNRGGDDPVASLGKIVETATTNCTDTISPGDSAYNDAHAAEDLEALRAQWDVPGLALLGIGSGARVALAYAGSHPNKLARLMLDSPVAVDIAAEAAAEQRLKGEQSAFDAFAAQCVANNCPLGPDPAGAVGDLLNRAQNGGLPWSRATIVRAITTALGYPVGDGTAVVQNLANALNAARGTDREALTPLVDRANALRDSDGQFVNSCSDALARPTPDRVRELVVAWGKQYPLFGRTSALGLVNCLQWPSGSKPNPPQDLKINVLILGGQHDPISGSEGVSPTAAVIINAKAASKRVMWQGIGHGAIVYTACAQPPFLAYLNDGKLPETDTFCPA